MYTYKNIGFSFARICIEKENSSSISGKQQMQYKAVGFPNPAGPIPVIK